MRVLVATDDDSFAIDLRAEYVRRGFEVRSGKHWLFQRSEPFDIVHLHWPEELVGWKSRPTNADISSATEVLGWWRQRSRLVCSVHNLLPHSATRAQDKIADYYRDFYDLTHCVGHFSTYSLEQVSTAFPTIPATKHFYHGLFRYDALKSLSPGRDAARRALGLKADDFALLTFGKLRSDAEVALVQRGIDRVKNPAPVVLFYARPPLWGGPGDTIARLRHKLWRMRSGVSRSHWLLSDSDTALAFEAADVLVAARLGRHLNSGLLPLAMTFGTPIAAPDRGVFREYLGGSGNELYTAGDPAALARAVENIAAKSAEGLRSANLGLAQTWSWTVVVDRILQVIADFSAA